jgi:hypothetical protein
MAITKVATAPQLEAIIGAAPATLDTLVEIDAAIGNNPNIGADLVTATDTANLALQLANQALNIAKPISQGTYLVSGGSVAFEGTRNFTVGASNYVINGTPATSAGGTVTVGAADATNPRFDAIVLDAAGTPSVIAGVAGVTPATPDVDPLLYLVLQYVRIDAAASAVAVAVTDIYRDSPAAWPATTSGASIVSNSTTTPRTGTNDVNGTTVANGDYVRFTAATPVSLAGQRQLVFYLKPKAALPNNKSFQVQFQLSGVKVGNIVTVTNGSYGFNQTSVTYQQIVIPIASFGVPDNTLVDRLQMQVIGTGAAWSGFQVDDVFLEGASTAVPQPSITALQNLVESMRIRTLTFTIDGGGVAITTGIKGDLPVDFAGKVIGWKLLGDQSGSIVVDVWRDTYANYPPTVADTITASAKPTITTATKATGSAGTWLSSFNAGDTFRVNVDSVTTLTRVTLSLQVQVG